MYFSWRYFLKLALAVFSTSVDYPAIRTDSLKSRKIICYLILFIELRDVTSRLQDQTLCP